MRSNEAPRIPQDLMDTFTRVWKFLIHPHPSLQEVEERSRAQLLGILTLILTLAYTAALMSRPTSYNDFIILLIFTLTTYIFSRTPYYRIGTYFFCFGFTSFAFVTLFLGSASSYSSAVTTTVHVSLVVASILLSSGALSVLVLFVAMLSATAPFYSQIPIPLNSDFYKDTGVAVAIGLILIGATAFRDFIERRRLSELNRANLELADLTSNLEQRVNERTAELEDVNQQTIHRAAQLQAVTELSESIAELHDLNEIFPATTRLISERFGFYHVGIFLIDRDR